MKGGVEVEAAAGLAPAALLPLVLALLLLPPLLAVLVVVGPVGALVGVLNDKGRFFSRGWLGEPVLGDRTAAADDAPAGCRVGVGF